MDHVRITVRLSSGERDVLKSHLKHHVPELDNEEEVDRLNQLVQVLESEGVDGAELDSLVRTGQFRDVCRSLFSSELIYSLGFNLGGATAVEFATHPAITRATSDPAVKELVGRINFLASFLTSNAVIGAGAEVASSIVREGKLDMQYNKPLPTVQGDKSIPFAQTGRGLAVQATQFWPFSASHGTVSSEYANLKPAEQARAYMASGAVATAFVALHRALAPYLAGQVRPVWLDASTASKTAELRTAIRHLREDSVVATGGYLKDVGKGVKKAVGPPSWAAMTRSLWRAVAASVALSGRIGAHLQTTDAGRRDWNIGTSVSIGMTWGMLSTVPARATAPAAAAEPAAATAAAVAATAPPQAQAEALQGVPLNEFNPHGDDNI